MTLGLNDIQDGEDKSGKAVCDKCKFNVCCFDQRMVGFDGCEGWQALVSERSE